MNTRVKKAQALLKKHKIDLLVVQDTVNLYYLTNIHFSHGMLLITPKQAFLAVDMRYFEKATQKGEFPLLHWEEKPIEQVLQKMPSLQVIGFDDTLITSHQELLLRKSVAPLRKKGRKISFKRLPFLLDQELRSIKEAKEIQHLQEAADLGSQGYDFLLSNLREGVSELELAHKLHIFWLERGGDEFSFSPIIAFGDHSALPHHSCTDRKLKKGDIVLLDIGVKKGQYCSDMTRTVFFAEPNPRLKKIYLLVQKAQQLALDKCVPGTSFQEVDYAARSFLEKNGFGKEFCHSLGHGVGLNVHEAPTLPPYTQKKKGVLKPGHVVTIEPGVYLPKVGGVRIEDTVVIGEKEPKNLTNRSKELLVIDLAQTLS